MSTRKEKLRKAFAKMIELNQPISATWAKCKSVSGQKCTITIDDLDIEDISLGTLNGAVVIYPAVGANVFVIFSDNTNNTGFVVYADQTTKVELMGNANGGMININNLVTQYNAGIAAIKSSVSAGFASADTALNALASGSGVSNAAFTSAAGSIQNLNKTPLENTKVLHGNG